MGGSLLSWLFAVCRSVCISRTRTASSRERALVLTAGNGERFTDEGALLEQRLDFRKVAAAVLDLPDRQREALTLRLIEGHSTSETALRMACAEGTVKALLHQAIGNLRAQLHGRDE